MSTNRNLALEAELRTAHTIKGCNKDAGRSRGRATHARDVAKRAGRKQR